MLLNSLTINSGVLGSGKPRNIVIFAATLVVSAVGTAKSALISRGKAAVACAASAMAHSSVLAYGKASAVVSASGRVFLHAYRPVLSSARAILYAVCSVYGRLATGASATGAAVAAGSAKGWLVTHGTATCVASAVCTGKVPWTAAPEERTFSLTAGYRTFILPKD